MDTPIARAAKKHGYIVLGYPRRKPLVLVQRPDDPSTSALVNNLLTASGLLAAAAERIAEKGGIDG